MPDDAVTTTPETVETPAETLEATPYAFPFEIPEDLAAASDETLREVHGLIREHAAGFAGRPPSEVTAEVLDALRACRDAAAAVTEEINAREDRRVEAEDLAAELASLDLPQTQPDDPDGEPPRPEPEPAQSVTAAAPTPRRPAPRASAVARRSAAAPQLPADTRRDFAALTASMDFAGFSTGQRLQFSDVGTILSRRIDQYPAAPVPRGRVASAKRPITVYDPDQPGRQLLMTNWQRHAGVQIRRDFPDDQRVDDSNVGRGWEVAQYVASEKRLPGGSLVESMNLAMKANPKRSLTAAAGWCAPSDIMYDLLELETLDGILDAPELQTPRGGWQIPENGGPDFTSIWDTIGSSGDTHLTEAEVIADTTKVCTEIVCPDFVEVRLGVDYVCLTGSLLQRRGYPEAVARFTRGAMVALAHKINQGFIGQLVSGSTPVILGSDPSGDDAASSVLAAVELAAIDIRYRHRMSFNATIEYVFPAWTRTAIRAALSRRTGVAMLDVTDAMIMNWFAIRGAVPRFVYDWQDAYSGVATGPGASTPITALPTLVTFLAYPSGTWVKAVQDVVDLDTVYDSTLLATNQYTAVFTETGWAALKMGPTSRVYTVPVDVSGVTGCCPAEEIS